MNRYVHILRRPAGSRVPRSGHHRFSTALTFDFHRAGMSASHGRGNIALQVRKADRTRMARRAFGRARIPSEKRLKVSTFAARPRRTESQATSSSQERPATAGLSASWARRVLLGRVPCDCRRQCPHVASAPFAEKGEDGCPTSTLPRPPPIPRRRNRPRSCQLSATSTRLSRQLPSPPERSALPSTLTTKPRHQSPRYRRPNPRPRPSWLHRCRPL